MQSKIVTEEGEGTLEIFSLPTEESFLQNLLTDIFENYWEQISFGSAVQGGIFETRVANAPTKIGLLDGYLTVDFGLWHFHICIGEYKGTKNYPASPELTQHRKTSRAELYRRLKDDGSAQSWGLRLFNGHDEQQMTVFLPNPFLSTTSEQKVLKEPQWEHLAMWDHLRQEYLGLESDATDRAGKRFAHG